MRWRVRAREAPSAEWWRVSQALVTQAGDSSCLNTRLWRVASPDMGHVMGEFWSNYDNRKHEAMIQRQIKKTLESKKIYFLIFSTETLFRQKSPV